MAFTFNQLISQYLSSSSHTTRAAGSPLRSSKYCSPDGCSESSEVLVLPAGVPCLHSTSPHSPSLHHLPDQWMVQEGVEVSHLPGALLVEFLHRLLAERQEGFAVFD